MRVRDRAPSGTSCTSRGRSPTTEFKLRYFGSVLGYLWTLLRPLMLFGVLYVVFTHIVRFGDAVPHYPVVLLAAIVVFNFFSEATSGGLGSLVRARTCCARCRSPARRYRSRCR